MLRPRRNPLIDGPVVVNAAQRLWRWRIATAVSVIMVFALLAAWPTTQPNPDTIPDEVWWRRLISNVAAKRLAKEVDTSAADQMKQRVAQLEADRISLSDRLAEAEKLLDVDRSQQRLRQVVARRDGAEIAFEILLGTPRGGIPGARLSVTVVALNDVPAAMPVNRSDPLALNVDRSTRLSVLSPRVAETLQGRLASNAPYLLVMLSPADTDKQTEALLVPVDPSR